MMHRRPICSGVECRYGTGGVGEKSVFLFSCKVLLMMFDTLHYTVDLR